MGKELYLKLSKMGNGWGFYVPNVFIKQKIFLKDTLYKIIIDEVDK